MQSSFIPRLYSSILPHHVLADQCCYFQISHCEVVDTLQQLVAAFAHSFINGERFTLLSFARSLAESILNERITPGTPTAKLVDESVEQVLIQAARQMVERETDPIRRAWEQCLDLYDRQPGLNTRTSMSVLQQAYSTPIPIAFLAGKLAVIDRETMVYEPTPGNGALLLLADPDKAAVNELNSNCAALRVQGFKVTSENASIFLPSIELNRSNRYFCAATLQKDDD